ncbi:MAG: cyclase family protein [Actinomycetia bacterium]|nr:cyclase family protein [Actinomycetes bacterium]
MPEDNSPAVSSGEAGSQALLSAIAEGLTVFDLGRPYSVGMPQSPNHPAYRHALDRRHGDRIRDCGGSAAADIIMLGCHVGTHIDALAHVSQDGRLHGGIDADDAQRGGKFMESGIHTVEPIAGRGVLLDVPRALGADACEPAGHLPGGYEITVDDLKATLDGQGTDIRPGDTVLIRSGWGMRFAEGDPYLGKDSGVPGVSEAGAEWLAGHQLTAVGADTIAFEMLPAGAGHASLPAHRVLLVETGVPIIETLDLEAVATAGVHEFLFVLSHLNLVGATGAPVRPLAIAGAHS